jgi:hypothetical protein
MSENFGRVIVCDFEYEVKGGEYQLAAGDLPKVLCMVAHELDENLQHVRTIKLWRGEFGSGPPFDIGPDTLFAAYSAWAELTCFMVLGWKFPVHIFDQHTAYLATSNFLWPYEPDEERRSRPANSLADACKAYGIEGWQEIEKEQISKDIGEGRWRDYGRDRVLEYCEEDVKASTRLLRAQIRGHGRKDPVDIELTLHWSNYSAKAIAQVQARGMLVDKELWDQVQDNKEAVILDLLRQFDPSRDMPAPIFSPDGQWSYKRFSQYLISIGVTAWPRSAEGELKTDEDTFDLMAHVPGLPGIKALRNSLRMIVGAKLPIGRDGRNRPSLFPFGTVTGRNAHAKSLFNAHAGMRSFMVSPPGKISVYLDWRTQEVGVAAARSEDQALLDAYRGGDVYHSLAQVTGLTTDPDPKHWKQTEPDMRQRMKKLQLAINYGMGVASLARGLERHPVVASFLIDHHRRTYPRFWQWREDQVDKAMLSRKMTSVFGWPMHLSYSPNMRTLFNFPMQSGGAEMLRLASWRLCEAGIVPNMLVHDGILLEVENRGLIAKAIEIMKGAGRDVCNGLEIGVDIDQVLEPGARYVDKRPVAREMWNTMMRTLGNIGVVERRASA